MCAARRARGGLRLQGKWRRRACVPHTPYMRATACCTTCFLAEPLIPTAAPSSLPWERARERATSRKACISVVELLEKVAEFGECPLPNPPPRGRERVAADSSVTGRLKKMPETSTARIFQVTFIASQMEQTSRAFFQTTFEPIGRVCAARHARGGLGLQGKWRTRACVPHTPYMRATACYSSYII